MGHRPVIDRQLGVSISLDGRAEIRCVPGILKSVGSVGEIRHQASASVWRTVARTHISAVYGVKESCLWFEIPSKSGNVLCWIDAQRFVTSLGAKSLAEIARRLAFNNAKPRIYVCGGYEKGRSRSSKFAAPDAPKICVAQKCGLRKVSNVFGINQGINSSPPKLNTRGRATSWRTTQTSSAPPSFSLTSTGSQRPTTLNAESGNCWLAATAKPASCGAKSSLRPRSCIAAGGEGKPIN
jgi:hypothetical protein